MHKERGSADITIIVVGLIAVLVLVGFFNSDRSFFNTVNYKTLLRLPCGLTVQKLEKNQKISFPFTVTGYVNGCGWENGKTQLGTVQVFDAKGIPVSAPEPLQRTDDGTDLPIPFTATLTPAAAPTTDTGSIIFTSTKRLIHAVPVAF